MNLYICGILDIIIVLLGIIILIIGYKKGFMHKVLSLVGFIAIIVVSFTFCTQLAKLLTDNQVLAPSISANIEESLRAGTADMPENGTAVYIIQNGLHVSEFIAQIIANMAHIENLTQEEIINNVANALTSVSMNVICFFIIFVVSFLLLAILKLVATILRGVKLIKIIDGILGAVLYIALYLVAICVIFTIVYFIMDASWFSGAKDFLAIDMQLDTDAFRLSKWLYETNPIISLFKMFGWA